MSYQEKENIVNIFSGLLIAIVFGLSVYQRHADGIYDLTQDFRIWGIIFLIYMGVSVVARIIIYILFHIINAIATREESIPAEDERLKLIKLKSTRNSYISFMVPMGFSFAFLAFGMPVYGIFIVFFAGGLVSEVTDNISQLYFHRKGV